jgi:spermidine synthase
MFAASTEMVARVLLLVLGLGFIWWALWPEPQQTPMTLPKPCPGKTQAVHTTIEVCDLQHPLCFSKLAISNTSFWPNQDLEDDLSKKVLPGMKHVSSGRMRLRQSDALVHIEALTCMPKADPIVSYTMASTVQEALGGGAMRWSAMLDPEPHDEDLKQYFMAMADLSEPKELLTSSKSNFSHAAIWRIGNATRLMLDNIIMSDSRDEHVYHEMLVHPALLVAERSQQLRVLIIGGGEGATLREVLRDNRVEHVTMVDLDESLVQTCKKHLPMMHQGSFDSPKATVVFEDGAKFIQSLESESFDVIIADGVDFDDDDKSNFGNLLFEKQFYMGVLRTLRRGGVLVQYMSDLDKEETMDTLAGVGFSDSQYLCVDIESFFGAGACFMISMKAATQALSSQMESLQKNLADFAPQGGWSFLTPESLSRCVGRNARRLKGSGSDSDSGSRHSHALFFGGHTGYHKDSDHCMDKRNKENVECNCEKPENENKDKCKPPPVWQTVLIWIGTSCFMIIWCTVFFCRG